MRLFATTAVLASMLTIGGALVATAPSASALPDGTNVCEGFVGDPLNLLSPPPVVVTGTLFGCHQQGSGTTREVVNSSDPSAPTLVTITWATGHATSDEIVTVTNIPVDSRCPGATFEGIVDAQVVHGPYTGSGGEGIQCTVLAFPFLIGYSAGPVTI
jgi:hypothetical protein